MGYEHIEQDWLRIVLQGDVSDTSIVRALDYTKECLAEDSGDDDVSFAALEYRLDWLDDASFAWYYEDNINWALDSLRNVWK